MWVFGPLEPIAYADDGLGGAEGNVFMEVRSQVADGTVQLSWDSPLRNELRVEGAKATAVLRVDETDRLAIQHRGTEFEEVDCRVHFAGDIRSPARAQVCPRVYTQSMLCQLIQSIRAFRLNETPAATSEDGLACLEFIETARQIAEPLEFPWCDTASRGLHRPLQWTNA
jgi:hypothetical protein